MFCKAPGKIGDGGIQSAELRALDQRITWRYQPDAVQFGGEALLVSRSGSGGEALAELGNFFRASAAAANFGTAAGCGHNGCSSGFSNRIFRIVACAEKPIIGLVRVAGKDKPPATSAGNRCNPKPAGADILGNGNLRKIVRTSRISIHGRIR